MVHYVKWEPFRDLMVMQNRMTRLFDGTLSRIFKEEMPRAAWSPPVDIVEREREIVLKVDLPEINQNEVEIKGEGNTLIIRGERRLVKEMPEESYLQIERPYGDFQRAFSLPKMIDREEIKASYKDGVLRVVLHFIGDASPHSPYAAEFLARVSGAEKNGYASYRDRLPADGLIEAYDAAVALVHTPKSEAFGLVVAEALARNLKVFAMKVGGVQDIAQGAPGAVLVEPGDWAGLEGEIRVWLEAGCAAPGASRELMASRYDPVVIARRHLEIYREVLAR